MPGKKFIGEAVIGLESLEIHGNGHMMMLEKNNLEIAGVISKLLEHGLRPPGEDGGGD